MNKGCLAAHAKSLVLCGMLGLLAWAAPTVAEEVPARWTRDRVQAAGTTERANLIETVLAERDEIVEGLLAAGLDQGGDAAARQEPLSNIPRIHAIRMLHKLPCRRVVQACYKNVSLHLRVEVSDEAPGDWKAKPFRFTLGELGWLAFEGLLDWAVTDPNSEAIADVAWALGEAVGKQTARAAVRVLTSHQPERIATTLERVVAAIGE